MQNPPVALKNERDDYWTQARQPLYCLLFLLPLLAIYEIGVGLLAGDARETARNGADYWMRAGLHRVGFRHPLLLPVVVIGLLAGWHFVGRFRWKLSPATLVGMFAESLLFGMCLVVLGQLQDLAFQSHVGQMAHGPH